MSEKQRVRIPRILAFLTLCSAAHAGGNDEQEVLVDCATIFEPYPLAPGDTAINCSVSPSTDLDGFVFCASGGESVEICLDAVGACTYWDPFVRVFDPSNVLVASSSCGTDCFFGPPSCSVCITVADLVAGCYTIVVSDSGTDNTGEFRLHLEEVPPTRTLPVLPYSFARTVDLMPTTDHDWFSFFGKGGSTIEIQVDQQGPCTYIDPGYTLYAPDRTIVNSGSCNTDCFFGPPSCSISDQVVLPPLDGEYTLRLWDGGEDDTGSMLVAVQCLFGCPTQNQYLSRNGSGTNPATYEVIYPVVPGACWNAAVDASDQPGAAFSLVVVNRGPGPSSAVPTRWGELLIDPAAPRIVNHLAPISASPPNIAQHSGPIPAKLALLGLVMSSQAVTFGGGQAKLRNAVDYVVGY